MSCIRHWNQVSYKGHEHVNAYSPEARRFLKRLVRREERREGRRDLEPEIDTYRAVKFLRPRMARGRRHLPEYAQLYYIHDITRVMSAIANQYFPQ